MRQVIARLEDQYRAVCSNAGPWPSSAQCKARPFAQCSPSECWWEHDFGQIDTKEKAGSTVTPGLSVHPRPGGTVVPEVGQGNKPTTNKDHHHSSKVLESICITASTWLGISTSVGVTFFKVGNEYCGSRLREQPREYKV